MIQKEAIKSRLKLKEGQHIGDYGNNISSDLNLS